MSKKLHLALFMLVATSAFGQDIGTIVTTNGDPVFGLPIVITPESNPEDAFVLMTAEDGSFSANGLEAGNYSAIPINGLSDSTEFTVRVEIPEKCYLFETVCTDATYDTTSVGQIIVPHNWADPNLIEGFVNTE